MDEDSKSVSVIIQPADEFIKLCSIKSELATPPRVRANEFLMKPANLDIEAPTCLLAKGRRALQRAFIKIHVCMIDIM